MPDVTTGYGSLSDLNESVENFQILLHDWNVISSNFPKLYVKEESFKVTFV